jgi:predicted small secreted protein
MWYFNMKMKNIILIAILLLVAVSFAGCIESGNGSGDELNNLSPPGFPQDEGNAGVGGSAIPSPPSFPEGG